MAKFAFDKIGFKMDGQDQFMISGEFHYFRVPAEDWKRRMELFKEAGGNCLATYVPWLIHEPEEGNIVFGDVPNRDLVRFLETVKEVGLQVTLRPGPYQYSELINDGLPDWLLTDYPQVLARDVDGEPFRDASISYLHPLFLEKARKYYRAFAEVVRPYMGDPVTMLQVDNELGGIHMWFGSLDYHPETMGQGSETGRYPTFLQKKYKTIEALNEAYGMRVHSWKEVMPIASGDKSSVTVCRRLQDYYDFYCGTLAEYSCLLASWLKEDGLDSLICHNSANPTMNSMFTETVTAMGDGFLLGSDHYYTLNQTWKQNNPTPQYGIHVYYSMEMMRLMGMPPSVLEMPGGTPADTPPILPQDLLACYRTNLAMGMKGCNYYVYTGGPNFPGTGKTCEIYDYNAHVRADGSMNPTYESLKDFGKFAESHGWMQRGGRRGSVVIGFEWKSTRCADGELTGQAFSRTDCWEFTRLGVIYTLMCSQMAPELINLDGKLDLSRPLIVPCPSVMSMQAQQALIDFAQQGGQLLLLGTLPEMDEEYRPCTLLREYLGDPKLSKPFRTGAAVNYAPYGDIYNMSALHVVESLPEGGEVLLTSPRFGQILGFQKGNVRYMAIKWLMNTFDQPAMLELLLDEMGAHPCVKSSNRNIFTALWEDDGDNRLVMVMNLYSSPQSTQITVYGKTGQILHTTELELNAMEVRIVELSAFS